MDIKLFITWLFLVFLTIGVSSKVFAYKLLGVNWLDAKAILHSRGFRGSNSSFNSAFINALNQWNGLSPFSFSSINDATDPCVGPNSTHGWEFNSHICGFSFGSSAIAVTFLAFNSSNRITDVGIVFNTAWPWDVHNGPGPKIDFRRVASHELGHVLGLDHANTFQALMNATYSESIYTPQADDINGLRAIYPNPEAMTTGDIDGSGEDDIIIDFGSSGIWVRMNNTTWVPLHKRSPEIITTGNIDGDVGGKDDVIIDFGKFGIWIWMNNTTWVQLHTRSPETMTTGDIDGSGEDDIIIDFGSSGIWVRMNNTTWVPLHKRSPEIITTGNIDGDVGGKDDVIIDFGKFGIWIWMNNTTWVQLHTRSPETMTTGDIDGSGEDDIIIYFGSSGIWTRMNNTTWVPLHKRSPESMTTGDIDGSGEDDIIIDFGSSGIWARMNNTTWVQLHKRSSEIITTGNIDGDVGGKDDVIIDFGKSGIWIWMNNSSTWVKLNLPVI